MSNRRNMNVTPEFVLAGEATFTVDNGQGVHRTYHVYKAKSTAIFPEPVWFAKMLTGQDNTDFRKHYKYLGKVVSPTDATVGDPTLQLTGRSAYKKDSINNVVLRWALKVIWQEARGSHMLPEGYSIKHIGKCGRCGAALTNPVSLDSGIGPECAKQTGIDRVEAAATKFVRQPFLNQLEDSDAQTK